MNGDQEETAFERHAQTIVGSVVLALLLGSGGLLVAMREDVQVLKTQVTHLNDQLKQGVDDRFRGADWRREKERLDERFNNLMLRVQRLEESHQNGAHYKMTPIPNK